ncbi:MAG: hypothetical protein A4E47_01246 [Methanosaeta sp. PtaU1.Bin028]|nr:MAG: hypothetical protein A4E47_01246 [Methanosaeta sp. PtaU1.Bin028]
MKAAAILVLIFLLFLPVSDGGEENDLWLLLSSYEDIGITVDDLAFFLATHGYDATPSRDYVTVRFQSQKEVYLTPNGGAARLADFWMDPPEKDAGPTKVLPSNAIQLNRTYSRTKDKEFINTASRYVIFPVTPLGMCYDGSQKLDEIYRSFGYNVTYLFDPAQYQNQGHLWVVVEDPSVPNTWLAVDSYYGIVEEEGYYKAPYSFTDFKYLDSVNPEWRLI